MGLVDSLSASGLEISTATELTAFLLNGDSSTPGLNQIYGADINTDSNTADGQEVGLFTQMLIDIRELLLNINASFDPDQAQGAILDQRVAINNIQRNGGTYTIQPITIVASATVTLPGLDANFNSPTATGYTVQDGSGNQFILETTTTLTAGTTICDFRAANIGDVSVPINTIVNQVTIYPGITSVNNPTAATTIGQVEETDAELRIRRQQSVALSTTGFGNGQLGQILNLPGVTEASFYQNNGNSTDDNGTPGHTQWLIVAGGVAASIANVIYNTINGAGMRGSQTYNITTPSGAIFTTAWDEPISQNIYYKFSIQPTVSGASFNTSAIAAAMAAALSYKIGAFAETSAPTIAAVNAINSLGGGGVPVLMQVSIDNSTWTDYVTPTGLQYQFEPSAANITITVL